MRVRDAQLLSAALAHTRAPGYDDRLGVPLRQIADGLYGLPDEAGAAVERLAETGLIEYVTPNGVHARVTSRGRAAVLVHGGARGTRRGAQDARSLLRGLASLGAAVGRTFLRSRILRVEIAAMSAIVLIPVLYVTRPDGLFLLFLIGSAAAGANVVGLIVGLALCALSIGGVVFAGLEIVSAFAALIVERRDDGGRVM